MKWRVLAAFLFAWLVFAGIESLSVIEQPAIPPQLSVQEAPECALLPAVQRADEVHLAESAHPAPVQLASVPSLPLCSSNGTPLLSISYYRAAYQAFHFSDSAG